MDVDCRNSMNEGRKIRILHISDIHAGLNDFSFGYLFDKRIFGRCTQKFLRSHAIARDSVDALAAQLPDLRPDYVFCTGDLTSIGSPAEFRNALEWLKPFVEFVGKDRFFYSPGNHDAYVPLSEYGQALKETFELLNHGAVEYSEMPKRLELDGFDLIVAGGARPCPIWLSTGDWFGEGWCQLDAAIASHRPGVPLLLMDHFPMCGRNGRPLSWRAKLNGWKMLWKWAEEGRFDAQISGHIHYPFVHEVVPGGCKVIGAGSLTIRKSCVIIEINENSGKIETKIHNV